MWKKLFSKRKDEFLPILRAYVDGNTAKAAYLLEELSAKGDELAKVLLARLYIEEGLFAEAMALLEEGQSPLLKAELERLRRLNVDTDLLFVDFLKGDKLVFRGNALQHSQVAFAEGKVVGAILPLDKELRALFLEEYAFLGRSFLKVLINL